MGTDQSDDRQREHAQRRPPNSGDLHADERIKGQSNEEKDRRILTQEGGPEQHGGQHEEKHGGEPLAYFRKGEAESLEEEDLSKESKKAEDDAQAGQRPAA